MSVHGATPRGSWVRRWLRSPMRVAVAAAVLLFVWGVSTFYDPTTGFSSLISIGDAVGDNKVSQLKQVRHHVYEDSVGYDGAYYVQIALNPTLDNPELMTAIDNLPYRAKRILFCWVAWALGLGHPEWVVQAHALLNVLCWLGLAWVLLRWFPPTDWGNVLRWAGVMFSHGLCMSVRHSLVDGPSLLLVALAMRWVETGRRGRGVAVLALAGLGKETNLLAVAGVADFDVKAPRTWWRPALTAVTVALPLVVWMGYIKGKFGPAEDAGLGNFTWPLAGLGEKWGNAVGNIFVRGDSTLRWATVGVMVALTVQWLFFVLRWRWADAWWRLGAVYAGMMGFLATPVWEGFPGASTRVLLPMTLAFNVLVPRGSKWWPVLIAGNLTVVAAYKEFTPPAHEFLRVTGEREVLRALRVVPVSGWYAPESDGGENWRWSSGEGELQLSNRAAGPLAVAVTGKVAATDEGMLRIFVGEALVWSGKMTDKQSSFRFGMVVPEGETKVRFVSEKPGRPVESDERRLAYNIFNMEIVVHPTDGPR